MIKALFFIIFFSTNLWAQKDSVAYFYSPKKVVVLLNEREHNSRIMQFLDSLGQGSWASIKSYNEDVKLGCALSDDLSKATCTFTFIPSSNVRLIDKELYVSIPLSELGIEESNEFEMSFRGSMKDELDLKISNKTLFIRGSKKRK